jgi:hypothetical protein
LTNVSLPPSVEFISDSAFPDDSIEVAFM